MLSYRQNIPPVYFLIIIWILATLFVNPEGEFPLNDDWAFSKNVQTLVEDGRLVFNDWMTMTLIVQMLWGALFCKLFGFSFTILRFSTLLLAITGSLIFYNMVRVQARNTRLGVIAGVLLAANPLYFSLSYTFMTDVPFVALLLLSFWFLMDGVKNEKWGTIIAGIIFSILCVLIRQFGLLAPLAFAVAMIYKKRSFRILPKALLPLLVTFGVMATYLSWLKSYAEVPLLGSGADLIWMLKNQDLLSIFLQKAGIILWYIGLFSLPLLILFLEVKKPRFLLGSLVTTAITILLAIPVWDMIPVGNILYDLGLGPVVLKSTVFEGTPQYQGPAVLWMILKPLGFFGGAIFLYQVLQNFLLLKKHDSSSSIFIGTLVMLAAYTAFLVVNVYFFDRYLLLLFPFSIILIINLPTVLISRLQYRISSVLLISMFLFSIISTHDSFSYHRTKWEALNYLTNSLNIPPAKIDGGFEFNGWHGTHAKNPMIPYGKSWYFVNDDKWVVDIKEQRCYQTKRVFSYNRLLPFKEDNIYLQERTSYLPADTIRCGAEKIDRDSLHFISQNERFSLSGLPLQVSDTVRSGNHALKLDGNNQFGWEIIFPGTSPCDHYQISVWRKSKPHQGTLVLSAPNPKEFYVNDLYQILEKDAEGWEQLYLEMTLPESYPSDTLKIYFWQPYTAPVWFDDLEIIRQRSN